MGREEHTFQFTGARIALAAKEKRRYHEERRAYWNTEFDVSLATVKATCGVKISEVAVTGGKRVDVHVDYGDIGAYKRMNEACDKIQQHRIAAERYASDARLYETQGNRAYELSPTDVHYFGLNGAPGDE